MDAISQAAAVSTPEMDSLIHELYARSGGERFGLDFPRFAAILQSISQKYLPTGDAAQVRELYLSIRVEELVLARACAAGDEPAWESFLLRYREKLYEIATYIAKEASAARELADSIYADLYGTSERDGARVSKLSSYTGRGSLEGWLRTVLAQQHVNHYRRQKRLVSLEEESEEGTQFAAPKPDVAPAMDSRLESAIDEVLASLPPEDRFVLASYYLDDRTLAETARILGVHESTISRKLDKLAKSLRKQILKNLAAQGFSRRQAEEALDVDVRDLRVDIRKRLAQEPEDGAFSD